ncbi:MAG: hypothetical protein J5780_04180, partial [Treponema sp.]|nr:hypothetical protein [Treponema sp.]
MSIFSLKKAIILAAASLLSLSVFSEGKYITHTERTLAKQRAYDADLNEIPLEIKVFTDEEDIFNCSTIPEDRLIPKKQTFNATYFQGCLWIDIEFTKRKGTPFTVYNLYFGKEYIDFAELFIKKNGKWEFYGRSGRGIKIPQMTKPSWDQTIPINTAVLDDEEIQHMRVKLISYISPTLSIKLIPDRAYGKSYTIYTACSFFIYGIFILAVCLIFSIAIILQDKLYLTIAAAAVVHLLMNLQFTGFGPVYIWNYLTARPYGSRISYLFSVVFMFLLALSFSILRKEEAPLAPGKKPVFIIISSVLPVAFLICSFRTRNPIIAYTLFLSVTIVTRVLTAGEIISHIKKIKSRTFLIHIFMLPALVSNTIIELLTLIPILTIKEKILSSQPSTHLINFEFVGLTLPAISLLLVRFSKKVKTLEETISLKDEQNRVQSEINEFYRDITSNLLPAATTMEHTLRLAREKNTIQEITKYNSLLFQSSTKVQDFLSAAIIFFGGAGEKKYRIPFLDFFNTHINSFSNDVKRKGQTLSITAAIPNDTVVVADENIVRIILKNFSRQVIDFFPSQTKIRIQLKKDDDYFILMATSKLKQEDSKSLIQKLKDREFNQKIELKILRKACSWYEGDFTASASGTDITFKAVFRLRETSSEVKGNLLNSYSAKNLPDLSAVPVKEETDSTLTEETIIIESDYTERKVMEELLSPVTQIKSFS